MTAVRGSLILETPRSEAPAAPHPDAERVILRVNTLTKRLGHVLQGLLVDARLLASSGKHG
eukprot:8352-Eustigmatos_ZCMA.PRE.1